MTDVRPQSQLELDVLAGDMCVARLPASQPLPEWLPAAPWWTVTRTDDELSIVCGAQYVPSGVRQQGGWRMLRVRGPLDFTLVGILSRITAPLAAAGIGVFAISTFDTDYLLVPDPDLAGAVACLRQAGMIVHAPY